jgi:capsular polysaccharide transport system permease protein
MKARSAFSIQRDVIFAIFLREMNARFSSYTLGNIWILLEPILMMLFFVVIFGARGRGAFGYVEPPVFILASFLPFRMLWLAPMRNNMKALGGARGLLGFRQVRLFDVFLARSLVEAGIFLVAGTILVAGMTWIGFDAVPVDPLRVLYYGLILWLFASAFGMLACVVAFFSREVEKIISIMTMPLLFLSAVFYPMTAIPPAYRSLFALNPLVHASELIREGWLPMYESPVASSGYLYMWTIITLALAVSSYRLRWQRMVSR